MVGSRTESKASAASDIAQTVTCGRSAKEGLLFQQLSASHAPRNRFPCLALGLPWPHAAISPAVSVSTCEVTSDSNREPYRRRDDKSGAFQINRLLSSLPSVIHLAQNVRGLWRMIARIARAACPRRGRRRQMDFVPGHASQALTNHTGRNEGLLGSCEGRSLSGSTQAQAELAAPLHTPV